MLKMLDRFEQSSSVLNLTLLIAARARGMEDALHRELLCSKREQDVRDKTHLASMNFNSKKQTQQIGFQLPIHRSRTNNHPTQEKNPA